MDFSSFPGARHNILKGDFLWQEGEASSWVAYLETGELEVVRYSLEGEAAVQAVHGPALDAAKNACAAPSLPPAIFAVPPQPTSASVPRAMRSWRRMPGRTQRE